MRRKLTASLAVIVAMNGRIATAAEPAHATRTADTPSATTTWSEPSTSLARMVTDRPDFTETPETVPAAHPQLEGGYTFTYDNQNGLRQALHDLPELLLRVGLLDNLELRVGWQGWNSLSETRTANTAKAEHAPIHAHDDGCSDLYLGFKYAVFKQKGAIPAFSLIPAITAPTGSEPFTSGNVDPEVKLAYEWDFTERLSLTGNVNFAVPTEDASRFLQTQASVSVDYDITRRAEVFVEYYGLYPNAPGSDSANYADTGLTYLITENFQIDVRVGMGLNKEADNFFTGVGFAWRY